MAFRENEVTGQAYRVLTETTTVNGTQQNVYDKLSFWTDASDVFFSENTSLRDVVEPSVIESSSKYYSGSLGVSSNTVTINCPVANANSMIDIYVPSNWCKLTPESYVVNTGSIKITFPEERTYTDSSGNEVAQTSPIEVRVVCNNLTPAS